MFLLKINLYLPHATILEYHSIYRTILVFCQGGHIRQHNCPWWGLLVCIMAYYYLRILTVSKRNFEEVDTQRKFE